MLHILVINHLVYNIILFMQIKCIAKAILAFPNDYY